MSGFGLKPLALSEVVARIAYLTAQTTRDLDAAAAMAVNQSAFEHSSAPEQD